MKESSSKLQYFIQKISLNETLSIDESKKTFEIIMNGDASLSQIGALLMGLKLKGESATELTGAVTTLKNRASKIKSPIGTLDTCGTGGDSLGTYNISTATAIVVASCGIPVAKHGNRSITSKAGSSDVLHALGVNINARKSIIEQSLEELGICFMMAPNFHDAMKYVATARQDLGFRTIFNLVGPLANPADAKIQLIGVFQEKWLLPFAETLKNLKSKSAMIVHGHSGMDELSVTGPNKVATLRKGTIKLATLLPQDAGLNLYSLQELKGGNPKTNAKAILSLLDGEKNAFREIVILNSAAALLISEKADNLKEAAQKVIESIDSGKAKNILNKLIQISNR